MATVGKRFKQFCYLDDEATSGPYRFEWAKNSGPLPLSLIESSQDFSVLTIGSLAATDSGNYSCSVRNELGTDVQFTTLIVKGLRLPAVEGKLLMQTHLAEKIAVLPTRSYTLVPIGCVLIYWSRFGELHSNHRVREILSINRQSNKCVPEVLEYYLTFSTRA